MQGKRTPKGATKPTTMAMRRPPVRGATKPNQRSRSSTPGTARFDAVPDSGRLEAVVTLEGASFAATVSRTV